MQIDIGKTLTVDVDVARLGLKELSDAASHVVKIGLRNILMDSHAGVNTTKYPDADAATIRQMSLEVAMKKLDALYRGEVRANATTRASSLTPVEKEAHRLAREYVAKNAGRFERDDAHALWLARAAEIMEMPTDDLKAVFAAAVKRRAARPDVIAQAEKNVAAVEKLNVADIEL